MKKINLFKTILISFLVTGFVFFIQSEEIFPLHFRKIFILAFSLIALIASFIPKEKRTKKDLYILFSVLLLGYFLLQQFDIITYLFYISVAMLFAVLVYYKRFLPKKKIFVVLISLGLAIMFSMLKIGFSLPEILIGEIIIFEIFSSFKNKVSLKTLKIVRSLVLLIYLLTFFTFDNLFYLLFLSLYFLALIYKEVLFRNDNDRNYFYPILIPLLFVPIITYASTNLFFLYLALIFLAGFNYMFSILLKKKKFVKASFLTLELLFFLTYLGTITVSFKQSIFIAMLSLLFTIINKYDEDILVPLKITFISLPIMVYSFDPYTYVLEITLILNLFFYLIIYLISEDKVNKNLHLFSLSLFILFGFLMMRHFTSIISPVIIGAILTILYMELEKVSGKFQALFNLIFSLGIYLVFLSLNRLIFGIYDSNFLFGNFVSMALFLVLGLKAKTNKDSFFMAMVMPLTSLVNNLISFSLIPVTVFIIVYYLLQKYNINKDKEIYILSLVFFLNLILYSGSNPLSLVGFVIIVILAILGLYNNREDLIAGTYCLLFFILYQSLFTKKTYEIMLISLLVLGLYYILSLIKKEK